MPITNNLSGQTQKQLVKFKIKRTTCVIIYLYQVRMNHCDLGESRNSSVNYNNMVMGFSRYFLNSASHWAPTAPSTTR